MYLTDFEMFLEVFKSNEKKKTIRNRGKKIKIHGYSLFSQNWIFVLKVSKI